MPRKRQNSKVFTEAVVTKDPAVLGLETVREDALSHGHELYVIKEVDETINNSSSFQNDDELFFPVLAKEKWDLELIIVYSSSSAADIKWELSVPGSGTGFGLQHRLNGGAAAATDDLIQDVSAAGTVAGGLGVGTETALHVRMIVSVGNDDGLVRFRWAQNAAGINDTVVNAGSYLVARRVS